jgi:cholesterol oxidase
MERISSLIADMRDHYDVVVVGSGYGGAIAACRLARAGRSVCVLERGRELHPGDFPEHLVDAARHTQTHLGDMHLGPRTALFDFHLGDDITVLVGCGLGGTSLINANVALKADRRVFDDERWPAPLRGGRDPLLRRGYDDARHMLGSRRYPNDAPELRKLSSLARSGEALGHPVKRPRINVTFEAGMNAAGIHQAACTGCGNCVTGCNHGAKNTVLMNYLPDAHAHGAEIFTTTEVWAVERAGDAPWRVSFHVRDEGRELFDAPTHFVSAEVVVLAAGTLGSTEILLRSARVGLPVSSQLGNRFSGNGDVIGFAYDSDALVSGVGAAKHARWDDDSPGPCITGLIDLRDTPEVDEGLVIEDAVLPSALADVLAVGLAAANAADGERPSRTAVAREAVRQVPLRAKKGPLARTQTYLVMSSDDSDGHLRLDGNDVVVHWPDVGDRPVFRRDNETLQKASDAVNASWLRNPFWTRAFGESLITVHPLGGCVMAEDAAHGVVDHRGCVFTGLEEPDTHRGLYVLDGSIVPRPLGVNPLLTISALAERACALMIEDWGWEPDPDAPQSAPLRPPSTPGLRFTERMHGYLSTKVKDRDDHEAGYHQGRIDGATIEFVITVDADDVEQLMHDPSTAVRLSGTVVAPALAPGRLTIVDGAFTIFDPDPQHVETSLMRYRMPLVAEDGREFVFEGHKTIHHGSLLDVWGATTTLSVTVHGPQGAVMGVGMLHLTASDLLRELTTMRIPRAKSRAGAANGLARFGGRFARELVKSYGGLAAASHAFDSASTPHQGRPLRVTSSETRHHHRDGRWDDELTDDAFLRLTRYHGGTKGPVLLAPGFGMSTAAFVTDTIHTNLTEFLVERGYDVWLFDPRWSPDLASSRASFTLDDVATVDWPKAVDEVRSATGVDDVQVVAHCMGSMTVLMAALAGMEGIRSLVCSQVTTHPVMTTFGRVKTTVRTGYILQGFGLRTIQPDVEPTRPDQALDLVLRLTPIQREERCSSAVCRWISAFYGPTHRHAQLNQATHDDLGRLFGVADLDALNHISRMVRAGISVDSAGNDVYLPFVERLKFPILFLAGDHNRIFLPRTSERTYEWLRAANGPELYQRVVLKDYAHLDGFIGRDAARDVFPTIVEHLDAHNAVVSSGTPR